MGKLKYDENSDLSKFLEEILPQIYENKINSLCIIASMNDGDIGSAYFNCKMSTKLLFAGFINQDAMIDTLAINGMFGDIIDDDDEDNTPPM